MPKHEEYRVFVLMAYWNEMCILVALPMRHAYGLRKCYSANRMQMYNIEKTEIHTLH